MKIFLGLLLVFCLVLVSGFVFAVDQGVNATISENITIVITPSVVEFGAIIPGTVNNSATSGLISFDASGSNVDVTITVTNVTGVPFDNGLWFDGIDPVGQVFWQNCTVVNDSCTFTPVMTTPTLNVPVGTPIGAKVGTITYTVMGPVPPEP